MERFLKFFFFGIIFLLKHCCDGVINLITVDSIPYTSNLSNSEPFGTNWTIYNSGIAGVNFTGGIPLQSSKLVKSNIEWVHKLPSDPSILTSYWYVKLEPTQLIGTSFVFLTYGMQYDNYTFSVSPPSLYEARYYSNSLSIVGDSFPVYKISHSNFSSFLLLRSNSTNETSFTFNRWEMSVKYLKDINVYSISPTYQTTLASSVIYVNGSGFEDGKPNANFNGTLVECTYLNSTTIRCPTAPMATFRNITITISYDNYWWLATVLDYSYIFVPVTTRAVSTAAISTGLTTQSVSTGETTGSTTGITTGETTGITSGETTGLTTGETTGITTGETTGSTTGETTGLTTGVTTDSVSTGETTGITTGETTGLTTGETTGVTTDLVSTGLTTQSLTTDSISTGLTTESVSTGLTTQSVSNLTTESVSTGMTDSFTTGVTTASVSTGITTSIENSTSSPPNTSGGGEVFVNGTVQINGTEHSNCPICDVTSYLCSNESRWNGGVFYVADPRVNKPGYIISSVGLKLIRMQWCNQVDELSFFLEDKLLGEISYSSPINDQCKCNTCYEADQESLPLVKGIFNNSISTDGMIKLRVESLDMVCISSITLQFVLTNPTIPENIVPESKSPKKSDSSMMIGIIVGVVGFVLLVVIIVAVFVLMKKKKSRKQEDTDSLELNNEEKYSSVNVSGDAGQYTSIVKTPSIEKRNVKVTDVMDVKVDLQIQKSEIEKQKELGSGSFGTVYKGKWRGIECAIKEVNQANMTEENIEQFKQEIELMKNIRPHRNVLLLYGFCVDPLSVVIEYCDGGSLYDLLVSKVEISNSSKIRFSTGIAQGMLHLHKENVIHRDLAARNILLDNERAKVSDFGMSRVTQEDYSRTKSEVGPIRWMSPESLKSNIYSRKSDVFSYGVLLFELITREIPYRNLNLMQVGVKVAANEISLMDYIPKENNYPPLLISIMIECLHENPENRPDFTQILKQLEN